jgi:hypothetical protein
MGTFTSSASMKFMTVLSSVKSARKTPIYLAKSYSRNKQENFICEICYIVSNLVHYNTVGKSLLLLVSLKMINVEGSISP